MRNEIKKMMKDFIAGKYNYNEFSYDMPNLLLKLEDTKLEESLEDIPEICASYDPYKTDESEVLNDREFLEKIKEIYYKVFE